MTTTDAVSISDWTKILRDALNKEFPADAVEDAVASRLTDEDVADWCEDGNLTPTTSALVHALSLFFRDTEFHIWGTPEGSDPSFSIPSHDDLDRSVPAYEVADNARKRVKTFDYEEAIEDAAMLIESDDRSAARYEYPIGIIFEGSEDETLVTVTVSAELTDEYDPSTDEYVPAGGRGFLETRDPSPISAFLVSSDMDAGSEWLETANNLALGIDWTFADMLDNAQVRYDTVEFGSDVHFYFDEDEARSKIERALVSRYEDLVPGPARPESIRDLEAALSV